MAGSEGRKGNHPSDVVTYMEPLQVGWQHAVRRVCLNIDPLDTTCLDKVVDVCAAEGG